MIAVAQNLELHLMPCSIPIRRGRVILLCLTNQARLGQPSSAIAPEVMKLCVRHKMCHGARGRARMV